MTGPKDWPGALDIDGRVFLIAVPLEGGGWTAATPQERLKLARWLIEQNAELYDELGRRWAQVQSQKSWERTKDRTARTASARAAFQAKFLEQAGGDSVKAEELRKAFYADLVAKSMASRRRNKAAREAGEVA